VVPDGEVQPVGLQRVVLAPVAGGGGFGWLGGLIGGWVGIGDRSVNLWSI
jgi:hypothetical protein